MKIKKDKIYSYEHTKQRAYARYGIELTPWIYEEWSKLCTYDNRIQIDKPNKQQVHLIKWGKDQITVVKSLSNKSTEQEYIRTVLPKGTKLLSGTDAPNLQTVSDWYKEGKHKNVVRQA